MNSEIQQWWSGLCFSTIATPPFGKGTFIAYFATSPPCNSRVADPADLCVRQQNAPIVTDSNADADS